MSGRAPEGGDRIEVRLWKEGTWKWYAATVVRVADGIVHFATPDGRGNACYELAGTYWRWPGGADLVARALEADRATRRRTAIPAEEDVAMGELARAWFEGRVGATAVAETIGCRKGQVPRRMAWALKASLRAQRLVLAARSVLKEAEAVAEAHRRGPHG